MKECLNDDRIEKDLIDLHLKAITVSMVLIIFLIILSAIFMQLNIGIIVKINIIFCGLLDLFIIVHLTTIQIIKQGKYYAILERRVVDTKHEVGAEWVKEATGVEIEEIFLDSGQDSKLFFDGGYSASLRIMGKVKSPRLLRELNRKEPERLNSPGKVFYLVCKSSGNVVSKNPLYIYPKSLFKYDGDKLLAKEGR